MKAGFFKKLWTDIKYLSPGTIREIVIAAAILCLSVVLSLPAFMQDMDKLRSMKNEGENKKTSISQPGLPAEIDNEKKTGEK